MRIQHNIMALNAYRQLGGNNSALAKNLEKLSSGYRINRAGDDAAGLAISEKMRAQIKGLEAAQKNANDGISLVQTAEGALTEVHSMLNRMVYLATQSANGTYDNEVDRANLDKEVQTLKEEINRISKSTNFNGLSLLDGSLAEAKSEDVTTVTGGPNNPVDVPILQEAATNPTLEVGSKTVLHKDPDGTPGPTIIGMDLHNVSIKGQDGDKVRVSIGDTEIELNITTAGGGTDLKAGDTYTGKELRDIIKAKFNAGDRKIEGQVFRVEDAGDTGLKFTQKVKPKNDQEVVGANLKVDVSFETKPGGHQTEYTVDIADNVVAKGGTIKIGEDEFTVAVKAGNTDNTGSLLATFNGATGVVTSDGYTVKYDATNNRLSITDPDGSLGEVKVTYDTYGKTETIKAATKLKGAGTIPAKQAQSKKFTVKAADLGTTAANDTFGFKGTTFKLTAAIAAGDIDSADGKFTLTISQNANGTDWDFVVKAKAGADFDGAKGNEVEGESLTYNIANGGNAKTGTISDAVTLSGGADKVDPIKAKTTYDLTNVKKGDKLTIGTSEFIITDDDLSKTLDATAIAAIKAQFTPANSVNVSFDEGILTLEKAAAPANNQTEAAPSIGIKLNAKEDKDGKLIGPEKGFGKDGTWNVGTTENVQGAPEGAASQLASTRFKLTADMLKDGNVLTIGNKEYTFKVGKDSTTTGDNVIDLTGVAEDDTAALIREAGMLLSRDTANDAFTIGFDEKTPDMISIHEKQGQTTFTNGELESVEEFDKLVFLVTPEKTTTETVTSGGKPLTFQVGDTSDDFQKVVLNVKDMSTKGLDIEDVSIGTLEDASAAIDKIKAAINTVSAQRGDLGAVQNRLEHTINNLGVQTENITAAESRIRDTDMAEEMMAYTKNNILVQAAQAMLAQANQVPQGILQLLQ